MGGERRNFGKGQTELESGWINGVGEGTKNKTELKKTDSIGICQKNIKTEKGLIQKKRICGRGNERKAIEKEKAKEKVEKGSAVFKKM